MEIRRIGRESTPHLTRGPLAGPAPRSAQGGAGRGRDQYQSSGREDEAPFWMVAMATDRMAKREYLSAAAQRQAQAAEDAWLAELAWASVPVVATWLAAGPRPDSLASWQALATALSEAAGGFASPLVVYQPGMTGDRGQFVFRASRSLVQLRPQAAGTLAEWAGTVAHECFHHWQHELLSALYRGAAPLEPPGAGLAAYYRDARNVYQTLGPHCPPAVHRRQALERGAWRFGALIAQAVQTEPPRG